MHRTHHPKKFGACDSKICFVRTVRSWNDHEEGHLQQTVRRIGNTVAGALMLSTVVKETTIEVSEIRTTFCSEKGT